VPHKPTGAFRIMSEPIPAPGRTGWSPFINTAQSFIAFQESDVVRTIVLSWRIALIGPKNTNPISIYLAEMVGLCIYKLNHIMDKYGFDSTASIRGDKVMSGHDRNVEKCVSYVTHQLYDLLTSLSMLENPPTVKFKELIKVADHVRN